MITIRQAIVVEGRYDAAKVRQLFDTAVITTDGFAVFNNAQKLALIRRLARERGVLILTDSDGAGFVIRNRLKGMIDGAVYHAYIPDMLGKEKRKPRASREGKLGVEGMSAARIREAVRRSGVEVCEEAAPRPRITPYDLYTLGLSGGEGSAQKRTALLRRLELPERLGAGALLDVLNALMTPEALRAYAAEE